MISICIPIFNFDVQPLVRQLLEQARALPAAFELILIDDGSNESFKIINRPLAELDGVQYHELPHNIGRSKIRNLFLQYVQYNYLLLIDSDRQIMRSDYLAKYLTEAQEGHPIVSGGKQYPEKQMMRSGLLKWKYGYYRESKSAEQRQLEKNAAFMTGNLMISKSLFARVPFNEKLSGYGHEDTLFGYDLEQAGAMVKHIDNPVLHDDVDSNWDFIGKSEVGIENLIFLIANPDIDKHFMRDNKIINTYKKLKSLKLLWAFKLFALVVRPALKGYFLLWGSNLSLFNLYKMCYFTVQIRHNEAAYLKA